MPLDDKMRDVLGSAVVVGGWHVLAETLPAIGRLMDQGYLTAQDDYEGPRLYPTEKGKKVALRLKLVRRDIERGEDQFTYPAK